MNNILSVEQVVHLTPYSCSLLSAFFPSAGVAPIGSYLYEDFKMHYWQVTEVRGGDWLLSVVEPDPKWMC